MGKASKTARKTEELAAARQRVERLETTLKQTMAWMMQVHAVKTVDGKFEWTGPPELRKVCGFIAQVLTEGKP